MYKVRLELHVVERVGDRADTVPLGAHPGTHQTIPYIKFTKDLTSLAKNLSGLKDIYSGSLVTWLQLS
jgi:hypothetical protein